MERFNLRTWLLQQHADLASLTSNEFATCLFAIIAALATLTVARIALVIYPYARPRIRRAYAKYIKWQVNQIFEWARWYGLSRESVRYSVVCAFIIPLALGLGFMWSPLWIPAFVVVAFVLLLCTVLGWRERGERATVLRFVRAFYVPALSATAATVLLALGKLLLDVL